MERRWVVLVKREEKQGVVWGPALEADARASVDHLRGRGRVSGEQYALGQIVVEGEFS